MRQFPTMACATKRKRREFSHWGGLPCANLGQKVCALYSPIPPMRRGANWRTPCANMRQFRISRIGANWRELAHPTCPPAMAKKTISLPAARGEVFDGGRRQSRPTRAARAAQIYEHSELARISAPVKVQAAALPDQDDDQDDDTRQGSKQGSNPWRKVAARRCPAWWPPSRPFG